MAQIGRVDLSNGCGPDACFALQCSDRELRRIDLSATSSKSCLVRIEVSTVSVTVPFPHRIAQGAEHRYRYGSSAAILSPYPIGEQATQFLVKKVSQFTQGLPAAVHSDDSLKFGPYKNLPALATNYDLEMVFTNNFPNIRLFNMARKLTLSHAYSSIMVEEKYDLTNESPKQVISTPTLTSLLSASCILYYFDMDLYNEMTLSLYFA